MARERTPKYKTDLFLYAELTRPAVVYMARNTKNGNLYIGVTRRSVEQRRKKHLGEAARGTPGRFYNAIRKHGPSSFEFTLLKECASYYDALAEEVAQIAALKPAYNVTRGGEGALGYRHTQADRERMRALKIGKPHPGLGKKRSPETVEKIRAAKLANPQRYWQGKKRDQATIDKIKATKKANPPSMDWVTPELRSRWADNCKRLSDARRRYVKCLDDGKVYLGIQAAADAYGLSKSIVAAVCSPKKPRNKTAHGLRFTYVGEP